MTGTTWYCCQHCIMQKSKVHAVLGHCLICGRASFHVFCFHRKINEITHKKSINMQPFAQLQRRRDRYWLGTLSLLLLVMLVISLCAGEQWIAPGDWFSARGDLFVWQIRFPRTLAVLLVGAALALSGAVMQALFENPLAEPGLLGVSNGAGVGLIAAVLLAAILLLQKLWGGEDAR